MEDTVRMTVEEAAVGKPPENKVCIGSETSRDGKRLVFINEEGDWFTADNVVVYEVNEGDVE